MPIWTNAMPSKTNRRFTAISQPDSKPPGQQRDGLASCPPPPTSQHTTPHQEEEIPRRSPEYFRQTLKHPIPRRRRARPGCPDAPPRSSSSLRGLHRTIRWPPQGSRSNTNGQPDMHGRTKRTRQFLFNFCSYCIELRFDGDRGIAGRSGGMRCNTITHPLAHTDTSSI